MKATTRRSIVRQSAWPRSKSSRPALRLTALVVQEDDGFYSLCPELDVASQGQTVAQAKAMLREAVTGYLESCFESNLPFLRPTPVSDDPRATEPESVVRSFRIKVDVAVKVNV